MGRLEHLVTSTQQFLKTHAAFAWRVRGILCVGTSGAREVCSEEKGRTEVFELACSGGGFGKNSAIEMQLAQVLHRIRELEAKKKDATRR